MGGFTKIPKLSVGDLGSEGEGDRIALFDEGGELVGWKPNAESGGNINNSYSTTEALTGGTWIDGKPIYRKVVDIAINSSGRGEYNIEDVDFLLPLNGWIQYDTGKIMLSQSTYDNFNATNRIFVLENITEGRTIDIVAGSGLSSRNATVILEYTKVDI